MASTKIAATRVEGLAELRAALKALEDPAAHHELVAAFHAAAARVASEAKQRASTPMERSMAGRLKASKAKTKAAVVLGGKPYDLGAEFGAKQNVPRTIPARQVKGKPGRDSTGKFTSGVVRQAASYTVLGWNQFRPWRGAGDGAGYVLFPTIRDNEDRLVDDLGDAVKKIFKDDHGVRGSVDT